MQVKLVGGRPSEIYFTDDKIIVESAPSPPKPIATQKLIA